MTKQKSWATGLANASGQGANHPPRFPLAYADLLANLKARCPRDATSRVLSVNRELILLYWDIGKIIVETQKTKGYGKQVMERLAEDLQKIFPTRRVSRRKTSGSCAVFI
jgi:hypothetical protein